MSELFLSVLNMSITASYVILFVILVRLLLKKAPKIISYALWAVVAFRLIIPFSFESMYSLMPRDMNMAPVPNDIIYQEAPQINSGIEIIDAFVNKSLPVPPIQASVNPLQIYVEIGAYIWILGIVSLLIYSLVSVLILKRQLKGAELVERNVFEAKNLQTPFVLGLIRPKIYLPVGLNIEERNYILLHEQTHIQRKDHIIKIFAFFTLSIHWFNPLVWIAFILMSTDMELSCDERVLKRIDADIKKPYANSLLSLATGKHILNGSPLAFGEGNVKGRIKNVLNYKKPGFWVIGLSVVVVLGVAVGLMSDPKDEEIAFAGVNAVILEIDKESQMMTVKGIDENSVIGDQCILTWEEDPFITVATSSGPTRLSLDDFSVGDYVVLFIGEVQESYPTRAKATTIQLQPKEMHEYFKDETNDGINDDTNYDKISAYLQKNSIDVFSPYYELLGFEISDYQEEVVNGNVEATFLYTVKHKNYDRDPDTVGYIQEAKERGDSSYQQLYDEYLQVRDMNFYFKAIITDNDFIALYTKNPAIDSEWERVEMSDFIIGNG